MIKLILAVFFSFIFVFLIPSIIPSIAWAEGAATHAAVKKKHIKKKTVSIQAKKKARAAKRHAMLKHGVARPSEKLRKRIAKASKKRLRLTQRAAFAPTASAVLTAGDLAGLHTTRDPLALQSSVALVIDQSNSQVLFEKNANVVLPIASITKLMTSLVVVEAQQDMHEILEITASDIDREKNSGSRLRIGAQLTRANMLHIALMSSENRAASALARNYPGGLPAFVAAMNAKAKALGMRDTHYVDANGLSSQNVASARDLAKLVVAAQRHPIICQYSTDSKYVVDAGGYPLQYANTNRLVTNPEWEIGLQKTGYISEAGRCLVMQAKIEGRPVVMVFLDSKGKYSRLADASRIRKWLEAQKSQA